MQHYPNGINLNLSFQEILNIDRLRYIDRVAASARGKRQDVQAELKQFETSLSNDETTKAVSKMSTERDRNEDRILEREYNGQQGYSTAVQDKESLGAGYEVYQVTRFRARDSKKVWKVRKIIMSMTKIDQMFLQLNCMEMQPYTGYSGW